MIQSFEELLTTVEEYGFLPFFRNRIPGFSVEEMCPSELWFTDRDGPWEWKGPAAKSGRCIYGKFFGRKPYGWGVAQYTTPEHLFGYEYVASGYKMDPSISKQKITDHLKQIFPDVNPKTIEKLTAIS